MDPEMVRQETFRGLISGILNDLRTLVKEEVALARVELREQAERGRAAAMSFGVAAGALVLGLAFLLIGLAIGIAELAGWPLWSGFLIVAALLGIIGFIALASGRRQIRALRPVPEQTVTTLKENSEWIAKRLSSAQK